MDAESLIEGIKRDHRRVLSDVADLESLLGGGRAARPESAARLAELVAMLEEEFGTHMAAEDEVLYPAVVAALPAARGSVEPLFDEHAELRAMLERLIETMREEPDADRDEQIAVQIADMAELLRIHIRKEESLILSVTARLLRPDDIEAVWTRLHSKAPRAGARTTKKTMKGEPR